MLRSVGGAPTVIGTGCPSSPVIVALTAAFALAGANRPATTSAAASILPPTFTYCLLLDFRLMERRHPRRRGSTPARSNPARTPIDSAKPIGITDDLRWIRQPEDRAPNSSTPITGRSPARARVGERPAEHVTVERVAERGHDHPLVERQVGARHAPAVDVHAVAEAPLGVQAGEVALQLGCTLRASPRARTAGARNAACGVTTPFVYAEGGGSGFAGRSGQPGKPWSTSVLSLLEGQPFGFHADAVHAADAVAALGLFAGEKPQ